MISFVTLFVAACQQPSFERKDDTKFCVYEGKEYSKGSVIKAEGVNLKCGTYSSDVFDKTLSWGK